MPRKLIRRPNHKQHWDSMPFSGYLDLPPGNLTYEPRRDPARFTRTCASRMAHRLRQTSIIFRQVEILLAHRRSKWTNSEAGNSNRSIYYAFNVHLLPNSWQPYACLNSQNYHPPQPGSESTGKPRAANLDSGKWHHQIEPMFASSVTLGSMHLETHRPARMPDRMSECMPHRLP